MKTRQHIFFNHGNNTTQAQRLVKGDITDLIEQARHENNIPAMAVVVMDSERVLLSDIEGEREIGTNTSATLNDYFHIGSCSKSILAVMAGKLIERGRLDWNTRFFDLFPELKPLAREAYLPVTLEALLSCRAGIESFTAGEEFTRLDASITSTREAFIKYLIQRKPAAKRTKAGFKHLYSNAGYTMAAAMLERVTGLTWESLIQQTLSNDLGLAVKFGWPNRCDINQPWGHAELEGNLRALAPDHEYRLHGIIAPAGDLSLKPLDYAKYVQLHLQGLKGMDNYLTSETYQAIHYRQKGFSLGVVNETSWGERYSEIDGSAGTFYCATMLFPDSNLACVVMANSGTAQAVKGVAWVLKKIIKRYFNLWWMFWM
jgi:CubicO group peptidase (beta-lactamase class C family)